MKESLLISLSLIPTSFFLVLMLTGWVRDILLKRAVLDVPNGRSLHKDPVPRGGGWALLIVLFPALIWASRLFDADARHFGLIAALFLLAAVSWIDDRKHVSPMMRLSMHILAACLGSFSFSPQEMLFGGIFPFWLDRTAMILGWAWFVNLYNFMDGIDGITSVETVSVAMGLCLVFAQAGLNDPFAGFLFLTLTGACLGFLAHNWPPAKIFLGDIGSVPLGYLVGFCLLSIAVKGHLAAALILPLYYLADGSLTLVRRALRGEKIWQAHREHFYQKAALGAGAHGKVVACIIAANCGLVAAALLSVSRPLVGFCVGFLIVAGLLVKMLKMAGTVEEKS
jgi:UDP-N-acetylmuramyl pentapeptide phosphotransferase/UDP-N-acetylglucosamine-1-phosphate transferase